MAIVDRQIKDKIVSRGLGDSPKEGGKEAVSLTVQLNVAVFRDELYYPATGVYSKEEEISGWKWDRTHAQEYSSLPTNEIKDSIGSHNYISKHGIPKEHYQGSILNGLELLDIKGSEEWTPVLKTGVYSIAGIDKQLYSDASICKIVNSPTLDISSYNIDNITVAIYQRDNDYIKKIYREYKQDNILYKYEIQDNNLVINNNRTVKIGESGLSGEDIQSNYEFAGYKSGVQFQSFYTKYFPAIDIDVKLVNSSSNGTVEVISLDPSDYTLDNDLGVLKLNTDKTGSVYIAYSAVPRVDIEINPNVGFSSKLNLKSHIWKQANGIIEVSSEEKHVASIKLEKLSQQDKLDYGTGQWRIKATALNYKQQPVDEIQITFKSKNEEDSQEIKFEGNLYQISKETNSSGEANTVIAAPLLSESSSFYFSGNYPQGGFGVDPNKLASTTDAVLNNALIFEVLKVDPFLGSNGLLLDVAWDNNESAFTIKSNFESSDYQLFRNALFNPIVRSTEGEDCFSIFYNSGFSLKSNGTSVRPIKNITDTHIYLHGTSDSSVTKIKLFIKNENTTGIGLERLLYKYDNNLMSYTPLKPTSFANNKIIFNDLQDSNRPSEDIVSGYRLYLPRNEKLVARCIDPASGLTIESNILDVNLNLSDIYKQEIVLDTSRIGIASYLSYQPVGNNIYFEGT